MTVNKDRMEASAKNGFTNATDAADDLIHSFRSRSTDCITFIDTFFHADRQKDVVFKYRADCLVIV